MALKNKNNSWYVADSYNRCKPITKKTTKQEALEIAYKLNELTNKVIDDIMDLKGYRYWVLLADYKEV